jgi:hypothetical protein
MRDTKAVPKMTASHVEVIEIGISSPYLEDAEVQKLNELRSLVASLVSGEQDTYDPRRQAVVYLDELRDHERHLKRTHVRMQEAIQEQRWAALASFDNKFSIALSQVRAWLTPPSDGGQP